MLEQSSKKSELNSEVSKMSTSTSTDITEMRGWCEEIADLSVGPVNWKDRVSAVSKAINIGWGRAKNFYYGDVRRVDGFEKESASRALTILKAEHAAKELRGNLIASAEHLERLDKGRYRATIIELRRAASNASKSEN